MNKAGKMAYGLNSMEVYVCLFVRLAGEPTDVHHPKSRLRFSFWSSAETSIVEGREFR